MKADCPKCGSNQTQSFAMVHNSGTSSGWATGVGVTGEGDVGVGRGFSRSQTNLAKLTAPPTKSGSGDLIAIYLLVIVVLNIVGAFFLWLFFSVLDMGPMFAGIAGIGLGAAAALIVRHLALKSFNPQRNEAAYKGAMLKWQNSWICHRCGNSFFVR